MSLLPTDKDRAWATGFRSGVESSEAELIALRAEVKVLRADNERRRGLLAEALDALPTKSEYPERVEYLKSLRARIDAALAGEKP